MSELMVEFITSLDGFGSAEGWPGWWGLEGPEYLAWLGEETETDYTLVMGTNTYQMMSGFAANSAEQGGSEEAGTFDVMTETSKVVFSSTLQTPLSWANTRLVSGDAIEAVAAMKREGISMRTIGSISLCRSLLKAGVVDRFRVVVFPVITGSTGSDRIYEGYPDVALNLTTSRTFDSQIQLLEYVPEVLDGPPLMS